MTTGKRRDQTNVILFTCCREEHEKHSKQCSFIKTIKDPYLLTVGEMLELEKSSAKIFIVELTRLCCAIIIIV